MATRYQVDRRGEWRIFKETWKLWGDGNVLTYGAKYVVENPDGTAKADFENLEAARRYAETMNERAK